MTGAENDGWPGLSEQHQALMTNSAISREVARARGYRTVTVKAELRRLGFGQNQQLVPALLIPIYGVAGEIVNYQIRPDEPRIDKDGKPLKYEFPRRSRMRLDVHPLIREQGRDPSIPLLVTEGVRKADSAISIELCCIGVPGVWNWRGTNELGGKTALADWESIALNGRDVYIAFDSDVMLKTQVHAALARLAPLLESRGATVRYIYLPSGSGGIKVGLDDYLADRHTVDELFALASPELRRPPHDDVESDTPYTITDQGMIRHKPTQEGPVDVPLSNFSATIVDDIVVDDGLELRREFELEVTVRSQVRRITVPASQFSSMNWVSEHLGAGAVIYPGLGTKDHLRCAIQTLSGEPPEHRVYAHTGWRQIDGTWVYLHAGGAIGPDGEVAGVEVALEGPLSRIRLPAPPEGEDLRAALEAALDLLDLLPPEIGYPLLGAAGLAPLRELLGEDAPDFVPWLHGGSGAFKSEAQALAQSFFGDFSRLSLPADFISTANAIERLLFEAKDALLAIDDYHPASDRREQQAMDQVANRLLRGVGNSSGRGRMRADLRLRPAMTPRAFPVVSGERLPQGHSNIARLFRIPVAKGAIDPAKLRKAQEAKPLYVMAIAGYLRWLARHFDDRRKELPARFRALRDEVQQIGGHRREPGQVAHFLVGLETFFHIAVENEALAPNVREDHLRRARAVLLDLAREHVEVQAEEAPDQLFLRLLGDGFAGRKAYLEDARGGPPDNAEYWGWEIVSRKGQFGVEHESLQHPHQAALIGVLDSEWLLLYPNQVFQFVVEAARSAGRTFPVDKRTLLDRLDEAGLIETKREGQHRRREVNEWINGRTQRVIKLRRDALESAPLTFGDREEGEWREGTRENTAHRAEVPSRSRFPSRSTGKEVVVETRELEAFLPALPPLPGNEDEQRPLDEMVEVVEWRG